jgi:ferredoxin
MRRMLAGPAGRRHRGFGESTSTLPPRVRRGAGTTIGGPGVIVAAAAVIQPAMNLVEVHFAATGATVFVQPGTTLLAAAGMAGVDQAFGCTRGMCGTDAALVEADPDALAPPADPERGTLDRMGLSAPCRLLCSARVRQGRVVVRGDAIVG